MSDWGQIAEKLIAQGAPTLGAALGSAVAGPAGGAIGGAIGQALGTAFGVEPTPAAVGAAIEADTSGAVVKNLEIDRAGEWLAYLTATQAMSAEMARIELQSGSMFRAGWRPALMWLCGGLLVWCWVLVPTINAALKASIATPDSATLITVISVFAGLYMGGHTVKDVVSTWVQAKGAK